MSTTAILVTVIATMVVLSIVVWITMLRIGLRWAKVPDIKTWKLLLVWGTVVALNFLGEGLLFFVPMESIAQVGLVFVASLALATLLPIAVISRIFSLRPVRALQAWLPTLLAAGFSLVLAYFVVRPYLFEPFKIPTNSMAPTILGHHRPETCSECNAPAYGPPPRPEYLHSQLDLQPQVICDNFHVHRQEIAGTKTHGGDRIAVAKFLTPRRWDIIVFKYPALPSDNYVKRLVGLPGETVFIDEGAVWIDGKKLTPPESIRGIEYHAFLPDFPALVGWGTRDRPAKLGKDEYFVLGDFSLQANDSRFWDKGVPGHPTYAVPKSHLVGVVTHTVWPTSRWKVHR